MGWRVECRAVSALNGVLCSLLVGYIGNHINRKTHVVAVNTGLYLALNSNLGNDLAIFEKEKVGKLKGKFFDVPPKVVMEVDIKADRDAGPVTDFAMKLDGYLIQKSQKLLDFGVDKVIWVITDAQKVYVIDRHDPTWCIVNWSEPITVLDGCVLNIKQLLDDEEITY